MNLYFMRHGIAVDRADSSAGSDDRARPLTPKGIKRMNKAAKGLATLSLTFERILTSPLERARQTAKIVAQILQLENRVEEIEQLSPEQSAQDLLRALVPYSDQKEILLVGHEPQLSTRYLSYCQERRGQKFVLKKARCAALKWMDCRREKARFCTGR